MEPMLERPCIITVCGLEKRKGVDDLIEAFRLVADRAPTWLLYIVGDGPERDPLTRLAARAGLSERVRFLGYVDNPKPLLASADIFALASHAEPFGLVVSEARQAGCAIVCTNVGGVPEVLEFGAAGALVSPGEPRQVAAELGVLMTDAHALGAARQRAKYGSGNFNVKRVFNDYMAVYKSARRGRMSPTDVCVASDLSLGPASQPSRLTLAVGIASAGRPEVLAKLLERLKTQTRKPDDVVVCAPSSADVVGAADVDADVTTLIGPRGSSHQRNAVMRHLDSSDVVVFFDDDFVPCPAYLENLERFMLSNPDVVMTTGRVIKDGILGPGVSFEDADAAIAGDPASSADGFHEVHNAYGCNMGIRLALVRRHGIFFDEQLPLYAWLEDLDFSRVMAKFGRVAKLECTRGVHLGTKLGRQPGLRAGYSQIANPTYLIAKGTLSWQRGVYLMSRNLAANIVRSFRPEPWVDRRGRLNGNFRAILDMFSRRLSPRRVLTL